MRGSDLKWPSCVSHLGVESGRVGEVVGHDVHEHEEAPVGLLRHGQEVAEGTVQGGEPGVEGGAWTSGGSSLPGHVSLLVGRQESLGRAGVAQLGSHLQQGAS